MGCSSTKPTLNEATPKLTNEKLQYILRNERLELLASDILDDCLKSSTGTEHGINEIAKEIIRIKSTTNGLSTDELVLSIKDIYVQQYLFNNHFITEHDLLFEFEEKFLSKTFNTSSSSIQSECYFVLQSIFIQYPQIQNGMHINFAPLMYLEDPCLVQSFYNNLKFNKTFQCELMHFTLNNDIIIANNNTNNNTTLTALSEIISCNNKRLSSLVLGIGNDITQPQHISKLSTLLQATAAHCKRIQSLTILNESHAALTLTSNVEKDIINVLQQCKHVLSFTIVGFNVSDNFMRSLSRCIPLCSALKLFIIDAPYSNVNIIDDLVNGISSSNSLLMVVFGGFVLSADKISQYTQMKVSSGSSNRHAVKVFEYVAKVHLQ
jgi:hypothetical protein